MPSKRRPQARRKTNPRAKTRNRTKTIVASRDSARNLSASQLRSLPLRSQTAYQRSLHALRLIRRGYSQRQATAEARVSLQTLKRYLGSELVRELGGRITATSADRSPRPMPFITALGDSPIMVRGSRAASLLAKHRKTVFAFLRGKANEKDLLRFHGKKVAGHELLTDAQTLLALGHAGAIDTERFYRAIGA